MWADMIKAFTYPFNSAEYSRFRHFNSIVASAHFVQFIIVICLNQLRFRFIPPDRIFVSGAVNLTFPNHMLHVYDGDKSPTRCSAARDMIESQWYQSRPHLNNADLVIHGDPPILDMRNTTTVEFFIETDRLNVPNLIAAFFFLSWAFQSLNGWYISAHPNGPRYIQYVEYSASAALTIVVMALNTGIHDLFTILFLFALFFGMNIFGVLAEFMMHLAEEWHGAVAFDVLAVGSTVLVDFTTMWLIPHLCGWVLFLFAWLPIAIKYTKIKGCSKNDRGKEGVPFFVDMAVIMESLCYFLFGLVQLVVLVYRTRALDAKDDEARKRWKSVLDVSTIVLSLVAKTFLAWALLGPSCTATID